MAHLFVHPAPGLGDLMAGYFVVPQNPIRDAGTPLVPSVQATHPNKVMRVKHIGELLRGSFTVPQNPLIRTLADGGQTSSLAGLGCTGLGCLGTIGPDPSTGSWTDILTNSTIISGLPDGVIYGGALLGAWLLFAPGGSEYRKKSAALRSQYRGYKRAAASVS